MISAKPPRERCCGSGNVRKQASNYTTMEPPSSRPPDLDGQPIDIVVADPAWHRLIPNAGTVVRRAAHAAGMEGTIVLSSDRAVRSLNGRHRGKNKPTNVLTYEHPAPEIILALGVIRAEAARQGPRPRAPLA